MVYRDYGNMFFCIKVMVYICTYSLHHYLQTAVETLKIYLARSRIVLAKAQEIKTMFTEDVLQHLELYCSSYTTLGIADDKFYKSLQVCNLHMKYLCFCKLTKCKPKT